MTRYTGYVIDYPEAEGKPLFGIIEDEGASSSLLLPVPSGDSHVHILNPGLDQETARQFRKKHGGSVGNWDNGDPNDLKRDAYPVLVEQDKAAEEAGRPVEPVNDKSNTLTPKADTKGDGSILEIPNEKIEGAKAAEDKRSELLNKPGMSKAEQQELDNLKNPEPAEPEKNREPAPV